MGGCVNLQRWTLTSRWTPICYSRRLSQRINRRDCRLSTASLDPDSRGNLSGNPAGYLRDFWRRFRDFWDNWRIFRDFKGFLGYVKDFWRIFRINCCGNEDCWNLHGFFKDSLGILERFLKIAGIHQSGIAELRNSGHSCAMLRLLLVLLLLWSHSVSILVSNFNFFGLRLPFPIWFPEFCGTSGPLVDRHPHFFRSLAHST